jgi:hypothetical protein
MEEHVDCKNSRRKDVEEQRIGVSDTNELCLLHDDSKIKGLSC